MTETEKITFIFHNAVVTMLDWVVTVTERQIGNFFFKGGGREYLLIYMIFKW